MASDVSQRGAGGLKVLDSVVLVVAGVASVVIAFWVFHFVAGLIWDVVKIGLIAVVVVVLLRLLSGRRR